MVKPKDRGHFAIALLHRMKELGLSMREVSEDTGVTYEHIRKIMKGETFPSAHILKELSRVLEIDYTEAEKLRLKTQMNKKYGPVEAEIAGRNPEIDPISNRWQYLNDEQKRSVILLVISLADENAKKTPEAKEMPNDKTTHR